MTDTKKIVKNLFEAALEFQENEARIKKETYYLSANQYPFGLCKTLIENLSEAVKSLK